MNKLRQMVAVAALSLILTVSAFAGTIHSPGVVDPPPPPPPSEEKSTSTASETTTDITTEMILTLLSLIPIP